MVDFPIIIFSPVLMIALHGDFALILIVSGMFLHHQIFIIFDIILHFTDISSVMVLKDINDFATGSFPSLSLKQTASTHAYGNNPN